MRNSDCASCKVDGRNVVDTATSDRHSVGGGVGEDGDFGGLGGADAVFIRNINSSCQRVAQTCGAAACNQRNGVPAEGCLENGVALVAEVVGVDNPMEILEVGQGSVGSGVVQLGEVGQVEDMGVGVGSFHGISEVGKRTARNGFGTQYLGIAEKVSESARKVGTSRYGGRLYGVELCCGSRVEVPFVSEKSVGCPERYVVAFVHNGNCTHSQEIVINCVVHICVVESSSHTARECGETEFDGAAVILRDVEGYCRPIVIDESEISGMPI